MKNVELARVLDKRAEKKKEKGEEFVLKPNTRMRERKEGDDGAPPRKRNKPTTSSSTADSSKELGSVLNSIF